MRGMLFYMMFAGSFALVAGTASLGCDDTTSMTADMAANDFSMIDLLPTSAPLTASATITDFMFTPQSLTIMIGGTVTWTWIPKANPPNMHSVVSDATSAKRELMSPTQTTGTWPHTFTTAGTFPYHCSVHEFETGSVTVVP